MKGITGEYGCFITSVGTWWGVENTTDKNGEAKVQSADIDVVALSEIEKKAVIGECKFKNEKIDKGVYDTLIGRGKLITAKYKVSKYIFFHCPDTLTGSKHYQTRTLYYLRWIRFIRIQKRRNINCGIASVCQRWL